VRKKLKVEGCTGTWQSVRSRQAACTTRRELMLAHSEGVKALAVAVEVAGPGVT
jgi:hypothetical protein